MAQNLLRKQLAEAYSVTALLAGLAAAATVLWFLWMHLALAFWPAPYPFAHNFSADVDSPALALELARNPADVNGMVQPAAANTGAAIHALRLFESLNWLYLLLYSAYLALFALAYSIQKRLRAALLAAVAALALSDALEIVLALRALAGGAVDVYPATLARWLLLALVLVLMAIVLFGPGEGPYSLATRRLLGLAYCSIALLLLLASAFGQNRWLALGNRFFLLTVFVNALGLAGPVFALGGVHLKSDPDFCKKRGVDAANR